MKRRPLNDTERANIADNLLALAAEISAPHAAATQRLIGQALDIGYPSKASGTPSAQSNQTDDDGHPIEPDTPVERAAIDGDRAAGYAADLLSALVELNDDTLSALSALKGWSPRRAVAMCNQCDEPKSPDHSCPEKEWPLCKDCDRPMAPGDRHGGFHARCHQSRRYHGSTQTARVGVEDLELGENVIVIDGVAHG